MIWDNYEKSNPERKEKFEKEMAIAIERDFEQFELGLLDEYIEMNKKM